MQHRKFYAITTCLFLLAGVFILFYTGPGRSFFRGMLSDIVVVPFLYFLCALIVPTTRKVRAVGVLGLAFGLEFLQLLNLVDSDSHMVLHLTLGATFDPLDFVAYTIGLTIALAIESTYEYTVSNG